MICASLVLAALLNCNVPSELSGSFASDTIPESFWQRVPDAEFQPAQPAQLDATRFDSVTAVALRALLDSAAASRVPTSQLIDRAYMGAAQHAPGAKILKSSRDYFRNMIDARAALGENSSPSEIGAGADLLQLKADGKFLQAIRQVRQAKGSALTSLVVSGDLVRLGIPANKAKDAVTALGRARGDEALNELQALVARNSQRGPNMAQDALDRYIKANVGGAKKAPAPVTRPPGPPDAS